MPTHTGPSPSREGSARRQMVVLDAVLASEKKSLKQISSHKYIDFSQLTLTRLQGSVFLFLHVHPDCFFPCCSEAVISEIRAMPPPSQHLGRGHGWVWEQGRQTQLSLQLTPRPRSRRRADRVLAHQETRLPTCFSGMSSEALRNPPCPPVGPRAGTTAQCETQDYVRIACQL